MKKWIMIISMILSMAAIQQVQAAEQEKNIQPYIGIGISSFQFDFATAGFNNPSAIGAVIKGGLDMYKYFGLEVRGFTTSNASSSGTVLGTPVNVDLKINNGFAYYAKLQAPFDNGFRIYGLIGRSQASLSATFSALGTSFKAADNAGSGSYGGGFAYDADNGFGVELEYMIYASDVKAASLFTTYHF